MSGCYRCGLPEGSDSRLCETCYRNAFHASPVLCSEDGNATPGIELSSNCQKVLLGGGVAVYLFVLAVGISTRQAVIAEQNMLAARSDYIVSERQFPVKHYQYFESLGVPS